MPTNPYRISKTKPTVKDLEKEAWYKWEGEDWTTNPYGTSGTNQTPTQSEPIQRQNPYLAMFNEMRDFAKKQKELKDAELERQKIEGTKEISDLATQQYTESDYLARKQQEQLPQQLEAMGIKGGGTVTGYSDIAAAEQLARGKTGAAKTAGISQLERDIAAGKSASSLAYQQALQDILQQQYQTDVQTQQQDEAQQIAQQQADVALEERNYQRQQDAIKNQLALQKMQLAMSGKSKEPKEYKPRLSQSAAKSAFDAGFLRSKNVVDTMKYYYGEDYVSSPESQSQIQLPKDDLDSANNYFNLFRQRLANIRTGDVQYKADLLSGWLNSSVKQNILTKSQAKFIANKFGFEY